MLYFGTSLARLGSHTVEEYSSLGRTIVVQAADFTETEQLPDKSKFFVGLAHRVVNVLSPNEVSAQYSLIIFTSYKLHWRLQFSA